MDNTQLLAGREFAAYDYLFEHLLQTPGTDEVKTPVEIDAVPECLAPGSIGRETLLALQALFNQAVARSDIQDPDVLRLCMSHETVIIEMKDLLNRLAATT